MIDDDLLARALIERNIADAEHIAQGKMIQSQDADLSLYHALIHHDIVAEAAIVAVVGELLGLPSVNLDDEPLDPLVTSLLSGSMASRAQSLPLALRADDAGEELLLAMADPFDLDCMDEVAVHTGINIQPVLAGPRALARAITRAYPYAAEPAEPVKPIGQEDSWAMFFEGNSFEPDPGPAAPAAPAAFVPQLGAEDSAAIAQEMRDRPTSMEFDLLDLEADPQPPMLRTMYLEDEDLLDLGAPKKAPKAPKAPPPAPPKPPQPEPQSYADIGNFFVDNDLRKSVDAEPARAPQDDADFFDSFFSEEALRAPAGDDEDAPPLELVSDRFDAGLSRPSEPRVGLFRLDEMEEREQRGPSSIVVADEEEFLLEEPLDHPGNHTSIAAPSHLARAIVEESEPLIELGDPVEPVAPVTHAPSKLEQLRARRDERAEQDDEPSNTAVASPSFLSGIISNPVKPTPAPAPTPTPEPAPVSEPAPRKLSLGKLGAALSKPPSAVAPTTTATASAAGLLKKAAPPEAPELVEPTPEPAVEPVEPANALGKLQLKKVPARPAAIEEPYVPKAADPATRAFIPDATTREMTDADLFSFSPEPAAPVVPRPLGAQSADEEAMLGESTRAELDVRVPDLSHTRPGPAPISGRSSTDPSDRPSDIRETSANIALTRAALLRMSRDSVKPLDVPADVSERQLLHAALSLLIEHGVLSLDDLVSRARKL